MTEFVPDGRPHRFKVDDSDDKKSGYYIGYRNFSATTGEEFYVVVYGSWRGADTKTFSTLQGKLSAVDNKLIRDNIAAAQRHAEKIREEGYVVAAKECEEKWGKLSEHGESKYLERKKVQHAALGVRFDNFSGDVYAPIRDFEGKLWSLQRIQPDGTKRFSPGSRVQGCFHTVGVVTDTQPFRFCEGLATAASVSLATGEGVYVVFDAGKLERVLSEFRKRHPNRQIILCGDDDRDAVNSKGEPYNKGRVTFTACGRAFFASVVFPSFQKEEKGLTDWNDLHVVEGLDAVRAQLCSVKAERNYLLALGFKEKEYFFTSSKNQQVVSVGRFAKSDFLNLMPLEYWEAAFPGAGAARVDWDAATSSLMDSARKRGIFESQNIRGAGVWTDAGRIIVNMGDHLVVDGKKVGLGDVESNYFYTLGTKLPGLHVAPLTTEECRTVCDTAALFRWKRRDFSFLVAGAMVTTRVCGALPIRPHLWVTGEAGTGKTTLFNRFIYPLIGHPLVYAAGNSTESGIRQTVTADAVPVLFDEFENNGPKSAEKIQENLDLMRLAWSETNAAIIKGSASGASQSYRARFAAIVTSIRQVSMNDADRSRFATVELAPHESDEDHWNQLDALLSKIDLEYGQRLFARTIRLLPVLLENFKRMKRAMKTSQRFSDQYGMLLAGYGLLLQDEPMSEAQAEVLAGYVTLEEEREEAQATDQQSAWGHLLTTKYAFEGASSRREMLIGMLIRAAMKPGATIEQNALLHLGIRVDSNAVFISSGNHAEQQAKVWNGTHWSKSWGATLSRLPGATRTVQRIEGKPVRCVRVPIEHLDR